MQQSLQVWRRSAPQQARCRCLSHRSTAALSLSQPDAADHPSDLVNVSFKVEYKCPFGQTLRLVGSSAPLGDWSPKRGQRMHWSRGDLWTCNVMLPAGSAVECKYVLVDEKGQEQRWQEGGNMVVEVPATCQQGLPVQRYDVGVSWCKTRTTYRAHSRSAAGAAAPAAAVAAAAAVAERIAQAASSITAATAGAAAAAAGRVTVGAHPAAASAAAATSAPVMAWALSKGASVAAEPRRLNPAAVAHAAAEAHSSPRHHAPALVAAATASVAVAVAPPPSPSRAAAAHHGTKSVAAGSPPLSPPPAELLITAMPQAAEAPAISKVATLVQAAAAASAAPDAAAAPSPPPAPPAAVEAFQAAPAPAFQLSSAPAGAMSIVLPSRSRSPPVKISLSSNFSKLMEMPALARAGGGAAAAAATSSPSSSGASSGSAATAAPAATATVGAIRSHAIDVGTAPARAARSDSPSRRGGVSQGRSAAAAAPPMSTAGQPLPAAASGNGAAAAAGQSQDRSRRQAAGEAPATPIWGTEYDVYATAYGIPYMHTPFDLEAYAVYDEEPSPSSSLSSSSLLSASAATSSSCRGSPGPFTCPSMTCGGDPLESAVQAAHCSSSCGSTASATAAAAAPGHCLLSTDLWGATAASTALAMGTATAATTAAAKATVAPSAAIAAVVTPQPHAKTSTAAATTADATIADAATADAARPSDAEAAAAPFDVYRHVSRSSSSVSDWAGRTLIELGSGRTLLDEDDSDEDETADDEAALAQALAVPAAPAEMAALLTQLGTALGRSVRLRYDGVDATAQDLLELDRKIALAASKLYRQRDNLLTGWLRKETRRQLAAAAAPATRPPMPGSNTVTPI